MRELYTVNSDVFTMNVPKKEDINDILILAHIADVESIIICSKLFLFIS